MNNINELAKLMADKKVIAIIQAAQDPHGLTPKEIAQQTGIATNKIYYTLKKMVDHHLLEIVHQKKIKNLQEYYYSSASLIKNQNQFGQALNSNIVNISPEWVANNMEEIVQAIIYTQQQFIKAFQKLQQQYQAHPQIQQESHLSYSSDQLQLSAAAEKKLTAQIYQLLANAKKQDTDTDKHSINFLFEKWPS